MPGVDQLQIIGQFQDQDSNHRDEVMVSRLTPMFVSRRWAYSEFVSFRMTDCAGVELPANRRAGPDKRV